MTSDAPDSTLIRCHDKDGVRIIAFLEKEMGINFDADRLGDELAQAVSGLERPQVLLNMDEVAYMCSRVIGALIRLHKLVWQAGGHVRLSNVSDYVHETFRAAKLHHVMEIYATEEEALSCFAD